MKRKYYKLTINAARNISILTQFIFLGLHFKLLLLNLFKMIFKVEHDRRKQNYIYTSIEYCNTFTKQMQ